MICMLAYNVESGELSRFFIQVKGTISAISLVKSMHVFGSLPPIPLTC